MTFQKTIRYIVITALFLIPFFPLIVANSFFFPFITGKAFYFRILIEIAFAGWVILAFWDAKYRPKFTPVTIGVTLFALIALVADLLGVNPLRSIWSNFERMEGWLVIAHLWMLYMVSTGIFSFESGGRPLWHRWFNLSLGVACIVSIYALGQLFGWFAIHQGSSRLDASLGNAAYLAVYLLMHVGLAMYMFCVARAREIANAGFLQWAYPIAAIIFSFLIFETQTRGTLIGLMMAVITVCVSYALFATGMNYKKLITALLYPLLMICYVFSVIIFGWFSLSFLWPLALTVVYLVTLTIYVVIDRKNVENKSIQTRRYIGVAIIFLIFLIGGALLYFKDTSFIKNSPSLNRIASISANDNKTQARGYIWPMALKGALERPVFGWGQENFNYIFNANYEPKMWTQEQWFDRAHSVFLDWFVASGFVGLIAYLALYVLLLMVIWRSDLKIGQKSVLTGLVAGYAVHNIFVFDNLASYVFFFALLGFGGSLTRKQSQKGVAKESFDSSRIANWMNNKTFSSDAVGYIVAPIAIVALLAGIYFLNVRPIQANTRLITALRSCSGGAGVPDTTLFAKALDINSYLANQEIREQSLACSGGVIGSQLPVQIKQSFFELASKAIADQISTTPDDARIYVLGGSFLSNVGQIDEAEKTLIKAHELTPRKPSVTIQLANLYLNKGDYAKSVALLKEAYESETSYPESGKAYLIGLIASGDDVTARKIFGNDPSLFETDMAARAYTAAKQYTKAVDIYKKLIVADAKNVQLRVQLSQVYYQADMIWLATETMRAIARDFPEHKDKVEAAIKEIQVPKK